MVFQLVGGRANGLGAVLYRGTGTAGRRQSTGSSGSAKGVLQGACHSQKDPVEVEDTCRSEEPRSVKGVSAFTGLLCSW